MERSVSRFVETVVGKLQTEKIEDTNLERAWADVNDERRDSVLAQRRKFEALLGFDAEGGEPTLLDRLVEEADEFGENAISELAATSQGGGAVLAGHEIKSIAGEQGFDTNLRDGVRLNAVADLPEIGVHPAWARGVRAAREIRRQENLGTEPISNNCLADLFGTSGIAITETATAADLAFSLDGPANGGRVVLRSKWEVGRRFELARLLGGRIAADSGECLTLATRTYTYGQKLQRAFSGEFLCPFEAVRDSLGGDFSEEAQEEIAEHFRVSPLAVRTQLVNHNLIPRVDIEWAGETI